MALPRTFEVRGNFLLPPFLDYIISYTTMIVVIFNKMSGNPDILLIHIAIYISYMV